MQGRYTVGWGGRWSGAPSWILLGVGTTCCLTSLHTTVALLSGAGPQQTSRWSMFGKLSAGKLMEHNLQDCA